MVLDLAVLLEVEDLPVLCSELFPLELELLLRHVVGGYLMELPFYLCDELRPSGGHRYRYR